MLTVLVCNLRAGGVKVRPGGDYLADALKTRGGMVELKLADGKSRVLFPSNGEKLGVMPMITDEVKQAENKKRDKSFSPVINL
jgi:hypothetical protein